MKMNMNMNMHMNMPFRREIHKHYVDHDLAEKLGLLMREKSPCAAALLPPPRMGTNTSTNRKAAAAAAAQRQQGDKDKAETDEETGAQKKKNKKKTKTHTNIPESNLWVCLADMAAPEPVRYGSNRSPSGTPPPVDTDALRTAGGCFVVTYNDHLSLLYGNGKKATTGKVAVLSQMPKVKGAAPAT